MGTFIIIIGIVFCIASVAVILTTKTPEKHSSSSSKNYNYNELDLEYRDLKNEILDLTREFNRTASFNTNMLDEKIGYLSEIREDVDQKVLRLTKLMTDVEILYNRMEKMASRLDSKFIEEKYEREKYDNNRFERKYEEKYDNNRYTSTYEQEEKVIKMIPKNRVSGLEEQVIDYFDRGLSFQEIAQKTGRNIGEIEFIMGLRRKR